ncbi:MAG: hypothetical protein FJ207_04775 [Gemmatimonadetes bacterium]|nr:hypothetical protein [Gemmatimonadota bacterium]
MLFYKQDVTAARQPSPTSGAPYYLTLLERDGNRGLLRTHPEGGNRGEAGDAWAVGGFDGGDLHALSSPALRLTDGSATPVVVHEVSVVGGRARLVVSTSATPRLITGGWWGDPPVLPVRVAGGVMPYTVTIESAAEVVWGVSGDDVTVTPSVPRTTPDAVISVRDAAGATSQPVSVSTAGVTPWSPPAVDLAAYFTRGAAGSGAPTPAQVDYLDRVGNANGAYDVGDLRKWLRTHAP